MFLRCPGPGETFGPFQVEAQLGRGGQGVVLRARDGLNRTVALKLLLDPDPVAARRFQREARILSKLEHPGLVRVLDLGAVEGVPFVTTELLEGISLREHVDRSGLPSRSWVRDCMRQVAEAVAHCHQRGVVHRDLKPENVMWIGDRPVVIDFGLARRDPATVGWESLDAQGVEQLTATGELLGTPSYMAPEQVDPSFGEVGPLTDVYGLGGLLHFLLTGEAPFGGGSSYNVLVKVMGTEPTAPSARVPTADAALSELCVWALRKAPGDRPRSAVAFGVELAEAGDRSAPRGRRRWVAGLALVSVVGVALCAAGYAHLARARVERLDEALTAHMEAERWEEAFAAANELLRLEPEHPTALRRRARVRTGLKDGDGTLRDVEAFLKQRPRSAAGLRLRGLIRYRRGQYPGSVDDYTAALAAYAAGIDLGRLREEELRYELGNALLRAKQPRGVVEQGERLLELDPGSPFGLQLRSRGLRDLRRFEEALLVYDRRVAQRPDDVELRMERGLVWHQWARHSVGPPMIARHRKALADLAFAAKTAPTQASQVRALILRGNVLVSLGQIRGWGGQVNSLREAQAVFAEAKRLAGPAHPRAAFVNERIRQCEAAVENLRTARGRDE